MSLINKLKADKLEARKNGPEWLSNLLTTLVAEANKVVYEVNRVSKDKDPADEEVLATIRKFIKNSEESLRLQFGEGVRIAVATKEDMELEVLKEYLPTQLSEASIRAFIHTQASISGPLKIGDVMALLKKFLPGQYDAKLASTIAKQVIEEKP